VFWLGLLTGAVIVGFAFLYGTMRAGDYSAMTLYRLTAPTTTTLKTTTVKSPTLYNMTVTSPTSLKTGTTSIGGDGTGM
jgi:hypothetical protein